VTIALFQAMLQEVGSSKVASGYCLRSTVVFRWRWCHTQRWPRMGAGRCRLMVPAHWNLGEVPVKYMQRGKSFFISEILQLTVRFWMMNSGVYSSQCVQCLCLLY